MRRTVIATVSTIVGLVMLLSFKTHGSRPGRLALVARPATSNAAPSTGPISGPGATTGGPSAPAGGANATRTIVGDSVDTPYGPVQLQVKFTGTQIVAIDAVRLPSGRRRDDEINSYAVPILNQEAMQAQSASIDTVSGATYTSDGYAQSLQSALDRAHA